MKGKLIICNGETIDTSTMVVGISLAYVESILFVGNNFKIYMQSGREYNYTNLSATEIAEVAEFVNAYTMASDAMEIQKIIKIRSI